MSVDDYLFDDKLSAKNKYHEKNHYIENRKPNLAIFYKVPVFSLTCDGDYVLDNA